MMQEAQCLAYSWSSRNISHSNILLGEDHQGKHLDPEEGLELFLGGSWRPPPCPLWPSSLCVDVLSGK